MLLQILSLENDIYYESASHFGQALSLMTLLRGTYHHLQLQCHYFPKDLCEKYGVRNNQIFIGKNEEGIKLVTKDMVDCIDMHMNEATKRSKEFSKLYKSLMLIDTSSLSWMKKLKKLDYNIYDSSLYYPTNELMLELKLIQRKLILPFS